MRLSAFAVLAGLGVATRTAPGEVVLDGTLGGTAGALQGPDFHVAASMGKKVGSNLFHSFQTFNLAKDDTATFDGPASVQRVFARVTGGTPSTVDGTLRCTIPNADFYL